MRWAHIKKGRIKIETFEIREMVRQKEEWEAKKEAREEFERLHKEGADQFGMEWLAYNTTLVPLRFLSYLPQDDVRINALLSQAVYDILDKLHPQEEEVEQSNA